MNILYLGWIGFNNFGDELLWRMFRSAANRKLAPGKYELVPSVPGVDLRELSRYDLIVLGGGSLLLPGYVNIMREALGAGKRVAIWGSGYDCFHVPKSTGSGTVRPHDVKENAAYAAKLAEVLNGAVYFGVRGPWTKAYLAHQGIDVASVSVSGDAGLLAGPGDPGPSIGAAGKRIGINWGTVYNNLYGADEARVESQLVRAAQALIQDGYQLYLYVVWGPDRKPTERLYERIGRPDRVVYDPLLRSEDEYAELMRGWDATLNLKLHASVMSVAAGVPFVSLGYRFKCFDFAAQLGTPELVVSTHESDLGERLPDDVRSAIARRDALSARFADERVRTKERLESFFDSI